MQNLKVASLRNNFSDEIGWFDVRCDRNSVLGNPFDMGSNESLREPVIKAYREWLWENIKLAEAGVDVCVLPERWNLKVASAWKKPSSKHVYAELKRIIKMLNMNLKVRLLCWCKPKACHVDVIESCLLWMMSR